MQDLSTKPPVLRWAILGLGLLVLIGGGVLVWQATREPSQAPPIRPVYRVEAGVVPVMPVARVDAGPRPDAGVRRKRRSAAARQPAHRISPRELQTLQRRYRPLINACYRRVAARVEGLTAARADIAVTLAAGGEIQRVEVSAGGEPELEACLRRAVRGFRFPASMAAQQVSFPVILR